MLAAIGVAIYPLVSNAYCQRSQSQVRSRYEESIAKMNTLEAEREAAMRYNAALVPGVSFTKEALVQAAEEYDKFLNICGDGIMGSLVIPKLHLELSILHGTEEETLIQGVGHLLGSSLPVGGESTHCVLTGHSGMASQRLFSDLEQIQTGDLFYLQILDQTLAYKVDDIHVVLPQDTSYLQIEKGADLCTLVTCTPYGVNSHRLLVQGRRTHYEPEEMVAQEENEIPKEASTWLQEYWKGVRTGLYFLAAPVLLVFIEWIRRKTYKKEGEKDFYNPNPK